MSLGMVSTGIGQAFGLQWEHLLNLSWSSYQQQAINPGSCHQTVVVHQTQEHVIAREV